MQPTLTLVDVYAASVESGIKPGTLRVWITRGKLTHHGHDHAGRTLIDLDELRNLKRP